MASSLPSPCARMRRRGNGEALALPRKRQELWPSLQFSREEAVEVQLKVRHAEHMRLLLPQCSCKSVSHDSPSWHGSVLKGTRFTPLALWIALAGAAE